jgi:hypothetical protein
LAADQFFRDCQRHALHVGEKQTCGQADSQKTAPRAVADYLRGRRPRKARRDSLQAPLCSGMIGRSS